MHLKVLPEMPSEALSEGASVCALSDIEKEEKKIEYSFESHYCDGFWLS